MGWEGRLGLMEIEILPIAQILVDAALISLDDRKFSLAECAKKLPVKDPSLAMENKIEDGRLITTLMWKPQLLS
jgi:hypothetical protein